MFVHCPKSFEFRSHFTFAKVILSIYKSFNIIKLTIDFFLCFKVFRTIFRLPLSLGLTKINFNIQILVHSNLFGFITLDRMLNANCSSFMAGCNSIDNA